MKQIMASIMVLILSSASLAQTVDHKAATYSVPASTVRNGVTYWIQAYYDPTSTWTSGDQFGMDNIVKGCLEANNLIDGGPAWFGGNLTYINVAVGMNGGYSVGRYRMCALNFPSFTQGSGGDAVAFGGMLSSNAMGVEFGATYNPGTQDVDSFNNPVAGLTHWLQFTGTTDANAVPLNQWNGGYYFRPAAGPWGNWYFWIDGSNPWGNPNAPYNGKPSIMYDATVPQGANATNFIDVPWDPLTSACISNVFMTFVAWYEDVNGHAVVGPTDNIKIAQFGELWGFSVMRNP